MMLLAAIVLLLGFIALAGMVSRVSLLAQQAGREQERPLLREVGPLKTGLDAMMTTLRTNYTTATPPITSGSAAYEAALRGLLDHLRQLEAARGYVLRWSITCDNVADATTGHAFVTVSDGELQVTLKSAAFTRPASPLCPALSG
jgi:hypothetical protein